MLGVLCQGQSAHMEFHILAHGKGKGLVFAHLARPEAHSVALQLHIFRGNHTTIEGKSVEPDDQGVFQRILYGERHTLFNVFQTSDRVDLLHDDRGDDDLIPGFRRTVDQYKPGLFRCISHVAFSP